MNTPEAIEGTIGSFWYHYDIRNDVLYLRKGTPTDAPTHGEESDDGFIVLRLVADNSIIGMTVINWWKRFGSGTLPDSMTAIAASIEPWSQRLAA